MGASFAGLMNDERRADRPRDRAGEFEKLIYQAPAEEAGLLELDRFEEKWGKKYPSALKSWRDNWIENFNRSLRKTTKAKAAYPSDTALLKSLYLAIQDITANWSTVNGWHEIFGQLSIHFGYRIKPAPAISCL